MQKNIRFLAATGLTLLAYGMLCGAAEAATPPTAGAAVSFMVDAAHNSTVNFPSPPTFPLTKGWSIDLGANVSYPLIVGGTIYVTTASLDPFTGGSMLYAIDEGTGSVRWQAVIPTGESGAVATYDRNRIFVNDGAGTLYAFGAATGQPLWSTVVNATSIFAIAPTAVGGKVYLSMGGTALAFDEVTGAQLWSTPVTGASNLSSPTVSGNTVYVLDDCSTSALNATDGSPIWQSPSACVYGLRLPVDYNQGLVYSNTSSGGEVLNAKTGSFQYSLPEVVGAAIAGTTGVLLEQGSLQGIDLSTQKVLWSFAGRGDLALSPVRVNQYVFIASSGGDLYALTTRTGRVVWHDNVGTAISGGLCCTLPSTNIAAGDSLLVVPAGHTLTAYH